MAKLIAGGVEPARDRDRPARPGAARPADRRGARVLWGRRRARGRAAGLRDGGRRRPDRAARGRVRRRPGKRPAALPARPLGGAASDASTGSSGRCAAAGCRAPRRRWSCGRSEDRASFPYDLARVREAAAAARRPSWRRRSAGSPRRWPRARCAARRTARARRPATGWSCGPRRRSRTRSAELCRAGRACAPARGAGRRDRRASSSAPGAGRSRDGCGSPAPTGCGRGASTTSSSARCRTASSRAATAAATPSSPTRSAPRSGSTRAATPTPRSATSSTPASRWPASGSSSPTATATRTARPRRARRCSTTSAACSTRRRTARSRPGRGVDHPRPRPGPGGPPRRRGALRGRARPGDRRPRPGSRPGARCSAPRGPARGSRARVAARIEAARAAEAATRAPGPLANPAVIESLAAVPAYGGTTLEEFDLCSYRWFAGHELDPQPLDPAPDPLVQGGLMHAALDRLYKERPGGDPLPRPGSLGAWIERGRELVAEIAAERELGGHPAERAIVRRVERLLARFLAEESERETGGFEPWLLEATFGEQEDSERPVARDRRLGTARSDRPGRPLPRRPRPGPRLQALGLRHPAREVRGEGEAAAAALPDRRRRALGSAPGRRPLPPAARHLGAAPARRGARRGGRRPRLLRPLRQRPRRPRRSSRSCSPRRGGGPARSSPGCGAATSAATPGPREGLRGHDVCPTYLRVRPDLPPRPGAGDRGGLRSRRSR